jgi:hypothetical protein
VLLQDDAAGVGQNVEQRVLAAEPPEERHCEPEPIVLGHALSLADLPHVLDQRVVLELDALRKRRRARRVEKVDHVVGCDRALCGVDRRLGHRCAERGKVRIPKPTVRERVAHADDPLEQWQPRAMRLELLEQRAVVVLQEAIDRDQEPRVGVTEDVFELSRGRPGVDPHHHAA